MSTIVLIVALVITVASVGSSVLSFVASSMHDDRPAQAIEGNGVMKFATGRTRI